MNVTATQVVYLPAAAHCHYTVPPRGPVVQHVYDFALDVRQIAIRHVDMNAFWLCCGPAPEKLFSGAWLLAAGDRVVATLRVADKTKWDKDTNKTYLRLWFVETNDSLVDLRKAPNFKIRVSLVQEPKHDLFLSVCGSGELFGDEYDEEVDFDERLLTWPWVGNNHGGLQSRVRWRLFPPFQNGTAAAAAAPPRRKAAPRAAARAAPPPPKPKTAPPNYSAEAHLQQVLEKRDQYGRTMSNYSDISEKDYEHMAMPTAGLLGGTSDLYDPMRPEIL